MKLSMINLKDDQKDFLGCRKKEFNFSKFVRDKLDEYIEMIREVEDGKKKVVE